MRPSRSDAAPASLRRAQGGFLLDLMTAHGLSAQERETIFQTPPRGTVGDRWHVYAHGYVARLVDALALELPAVSRILGDAAFGALVARYVAACPPGSHDLAHAGRKLAAFLESDPLTLGLPFLPDLARLERLIAEAFVAADAEPLTWTSLQALPPDAVAELPLALLPGTALVSSRWPLLELWRTRDAVDEDVDIDVSGGRSSDLVVFRRGFDVRCEPVDAAESFLLAAVRGATTLASLSSRALTPYPDFLLSWKRLVERGLFQSARNSPDTSGHL